MLRFKTKASPVDSFKTAIERLGVEMLHLDDVKAVMMSVDEDGNIAVTLVQGKEESHKVKFGSIDRRFEKFQFAQSSASIR